MQTLDLLSQLQAGIHQPLHISGLTQVALGFLLSEWIQKESLNLLLICPDAESTQALEEDLNAFLKSKKDQNTQVIVLPSWEQSPYQPMSLSIRIRHSRIRALSQIRDEKRKKKILLTSLAGISQPTIPPTYWTESQTTLETEKSISSREDLRLRLIYSGYLEVDPVEDRGSFSIRGEIIDIFPPDRERPIRVELFGDEIEKIREFDASSQRTLPSGENKILRISIPPARETLINAKTYPYLRSQIKLDADQRGISRQVRDPIIESFDVGVYPDHSEAWAAYAYPEKTTLLDHLSPDWILGWWDQIACEQRFDEDFRQERKFYSDPQSGLILPPPIVLFEYGDEHFREKVKKKIKLFFNRIDLTEAKDLPHGDNQGTSERRNKVSIKANLDFIQDRKKDPKNVKGWITSWLEKDYEIKIFSSLESRSDRISYFLAENNFDPKRISLHLGKVSEGFRWARLKLVVLTDHEIMGTTQKIQRAIQKNEFTQSVSINALSDLNPKDFIVHIDHGIGRYQGLVRLDLDGAPSDFLQIDYAQGDRLYLPIYRINLVQKYMGGSQSVRLDRLGGQSFLKAKEKVKDAVKKLAFSLVDLYAKRQLQKGQIFGPIDQTLEEFEEGFPYEETPDQLKAINSTLADLQSGQVMDRIVCGDVGFGKTEVAIRAAFFAVLGGAQVSVLVPTTVLAQQHTESFQERLKNYPVTIASLSRFKTAQDQRKTLSELKEGRIDILIGTHRLLSHDVQFKNLGLIIVDEEHRFGVEHKEKLKSLKLNTHVLTLTATPIPRTLNMALSGLREISLMSTPPIDRLPIRTYVAKYDESMIKKAIEFELGRGGQVFFLHNRVQSISKIAQTIQDLIPHAKIGVAHGQMKERELEKQMLDFYHKKTNVLVCTTIVESGLDVPSANTIIIHRADTFGLAQLYQLRGRVGRSHQRAYAYLLVSSSGKLSEEGRKRLEVLQRFVELGSGFQIASHDLELRGGGNLLGGEQSGHIATVGFELYMELLNEAIQEIQGKSHHPQLSIREPEIKVPFAAYLDEDYVRDIRQRLSLYRRLSDAKGVEDLELFEEELLDRFGKLTEETSNLLWLIRVKILLKESGIEVLKAGKERFSIQSSPENPFDPARAIALIAAHPKEYKLTPDSRLIVSHHANSLKELYFELEKLVKELTNKE
jgi:transcription-repair coupling factor (superfamily II helicase)